MMSRGVRAERQANLRLLESLQRETDAKREEVEAQHAATPPLPVEQFHDTVMRVLARAPETLFEFFRDYRVRMAGKNPFCYLYPSPRNSRHHDDPEMAAAVERVNVALNAYDDARLDLRITELFGGRYSWEQSGGHERRSGQLDDGRIALDILSAMIQTSKIDAYYRSLNGEDGQVVDRENMHKLMENWASFVDMSIAEE